MLFITCVTLLASDPSVVFIQDSSLTPILRRTASFWLCLPFITATFQKVFLFSIFCDMHHVSYAYVTFGKIKHGDILTFDFSVISRLVNSFHNLEKVDFPMLILLQISLPDLPPSVPSCPKHAKLFTCFIGELSKTMPIFCSLLILEKKSSS